MDIFANPFGNIGSGSQYSDIDNDGDIDLSDNDYDYDGPITRTMTGGTNATQYTQYSKNDSEKILAETEVQQFIEIQKNSENHSDRCNHNQHTQHSKTTIRPISKSKRHPNNSESQSAEATIGTHMLHSMDIDDNILDSLLDIVDAYGDDDDEENNDEPYHDETTPPPSTRIQIHNLSSNDHQDLSISDIHRISPHHQSHSASRSFGHSLNINGVITGHSTQTSNPTTNTTNSSPSTSTSMHTPVPSPKTMTTPILNTSNSHHHSLSKSIVTNKCSRRKSGKTSPIICVSSPAETMAMAMAQPLPLSESMTVDTRHRLSDRYKNRSREVLDSVHNKASDNDEYRSSDLVLSGSDFDSEYTEDDDHNFEDCGLGLEDRTLPFDFEKPLRFKPMSTVVVDRQIQQIQTAIIKTTYKQYVEFDSSDDDSHSSASEDGYGVGVGVGVGDAQKLGNKIQKFVRRTRDRDRDRDCDISSDDEDNYYGMKDYNRGRVDLPPAEMSKIEIYIL